MGINKTNKNKKFYTLPLVAVLILVSIFSFLKVTVRSVNISEQSIISQINAIRRQNNLKDLKVNKNLSLAAKSKAKDMYEINYFSHTSPKEIKWSEFIKESGYKYTFAGENLAKGYYESSEVISDWMSSNSHRDNILYPDYVDTGVSCIESINMGMIIVQVFGNPEIPKK